MTLPSGALSCPQAVCAPPKDTAAVGLSSFERLGELALETEGFLWLSGVDEHLAGLTEAEASACGGWIDPAANAFSFCVNGVTFTATEDPDDGYRSALNVLFERPGNHCKNAFIPVPLLLAFDYQFRDLQGLARALDQDFDPALVSLRYEGQNDDILCVGTEDAEDYYPSFVSHFSPELFTQAMIDFQRRVLTDETAALGAQRAPSPRL